MIRVNFCMVNFNIGHLGNWLQKKYKWAKTDTQSKTNLF